MARYWVFCLKMLRKICECLFESASVNALLSFQVGNGL